MFSFSLVTPYSVLEFKVYSQNTLRSNTLIGQYNLDLHKALEENRGKCKSVYIARYKALFVFQPKSADNLLMVFTISIGTPHLLTILVLKFETVHSTTS